MPVNTVEVKINGKAVQVGKDSTILEAARLANVNIPTLCAHPDLVPWAACGVCVVKVEGSPKQVRSCATRVTAGQNYITHDPELQETRKTVLELILSNHPSDCLKCARNTTCELQQLAADFSIRELPFAYNVKRLPVDDSTPSVVLDPSKCINCGRCAQVCQQLQNVWALEFLHRGDKTRIAPAGGILLNDSPCIKCGQCSAHCPVGAIYEKDETEKLLAAIRNENLHVAVQIAPAVRAALGEMFNLPAGTLVTNKIYAALRKLGCDVVFDTNFSADLTIMEEGSELVERLTKGTGALPQITSCCPAWTDYMEKYYPDMIPHFSTAKSPMMMQGAITKTYYANQISKKPEEIFSVAIMPCTAKKYEITRSDEMYASGCQDVDLVLTTRELGRLIKAMGIDFVSLSDEPADSPIGKYSGAGTIFGNTGGVMEAAVRTAYKLVTGEELANVQIEAVRGMDGVRTGAVDFKGTEIKVAVAHGMAHVQSIMEEVRVAREKGQEIPYHFIEVMACRGGCVAGGGQPYNTDDKVRAKRIAALYTDDEISEVRCSHQNPEIIEIYEKFLQKPLSHKSHELLHTKYQPRPLYVK